MMVGSLPIFENFNLIFHRFHLDYSFLSFHHHHYHCHCSCFQNGLICVYFFYFLDYSDYQTYYSYPPKIDQFHLYFPLIIALFRLNLVNPFQSCEQRLGSLYLLFSSLNVSAVCVSNLQKRHL